MNKKFLAKNLQNGKNDLIYKLRRTQLIGYVLMVGLIVSLAVITLLGVRLKEMQDVRQVEMVAEKGQVVSSHSIQQGDGSYIVELQIKPNNDLQFDDGAVYKRFTVIDK